MTELTRELIYGKRPIKRQNPKLGQSEWYYLDPRGTDRFADMQEIDVESENSPNPYANEIQNYLYENDEYNYNKLYGDTPPPEQPQAKSNDPNCYMTFNGQNLDLYNNTGLVNSLDAQSGHDAYQSAQYQNVAKEGPIPEGTYFANQDQRQNISAKDVLWGFIAPVANKLLPKPRGTWMGSLPAWGTKRVWLQPDQNTNTYGRDGFTIHGGFRKGSAGCIDIPWQTGKLWDYLDDCQDSVPVYVKYPKNW